MSNHSSHMSQNSLQPSVSKMSIKESDSKFSMNSTEKSILVLDDIKNIKHILRKQKCLNKSNCTTSEKTSSAATWLKHCDSPNLSIENNKATPIITSVSQSKNKTTLYDYGFCKKSSFQLSFFTNEATIKAAFEKKDNRTNLIGDFSQSFILPLLPLSNHVNLHPISSETLAELIKGTYSHYISSYLIIDCRYPYEYEGGHIRDAINIFTKEQLLKNYNEDKLGKKSPKPENINEKRNILIFHCEFSSKRGPSLSRFMRNIDRQKNVMCYPYLDYPEMYLLDGGYCKFYNQFSQLCVPSNYRPMDDPDFAMELKKFHSKPKIKNHQYDETAFLVTKKKVKRLGFN